MQNEDENYGLETYREERVYEIENNKYGARLRVVREPDEATTMEGQLELDTMFKIEKSACFDVLGEKTFFYGNHGLGREIGRFGLISNPKFKFDTAV